MNDGLILNGIDTKECMIGTVNRGIYRCGSSKGHKTFLFEFVYYGNWLIKHQVSATNEVGLVVVSGWDAKYSCASP